MANTVRILITAKDEVSTQLDKIRDKASLLSKTDIGKGMSMGLGIASFASIKSVADKALDAVVQFGVGSVKAASDQREAVSLTAQVFGIATDSVKEWSKNQKDAFSSTEALNFASTFGTAFKNVGMTLDETTAKAEAMTTLAGDLGSAFNTSSAEAATALKSGLLGESEPLRRFGVFLDEAKVKAQAAAMGMKPLNGALSDGQKVAARYAIIMKQTADSQGMFGRDTDSLADSQKMLSSAVDDLQAKLGEKLTPMLAQAAQGMTEFVTASGAQGGGFDQIADSAHRFEVTLNGITDAGVNLHRTIMGEKWLGEEVDTTTTAIVDQADALGSQHDRARSAERASRNLSDALAEQHDTTKNAARSTHALSVQLGTTYERVKDARGEMERLHDRVLDAIGDFKDLGKWATRAGDQLAESSYGPEELKLKFDGVKLSLQQNESELKKTQAKIKELHDKGKHVPVDLKTKFNDLKQSVNDGKQEVIRLGTRLEVTGGISMASLRKQFDRLGIHIDETSDAARVLWHYLNLISNTDLGTIYDNAHGGHGRAAGGPVAPYSTYMVGEHNPELFNSGSSGGRIMPSVGGMSGGGGGGVSISISTPLMTPGSGQALASTLAPLVAKELQRQQLIARR